MDDLTGELFLSCTKVASMKRCSNKQKWTDLQDQQMHVTVIEMFEKILKLMPVFCI